MSLSDDKKKRPRPTTPTPAQSVLPILTRLSPLPPQEWEYFEARLSFVTLARGEALTRAGEIADRLGFVVSGLMRKIHFAAQGRTVVRGFGGPGSFVGSYVALLSGHPSYLTVDALEPTELFVLPWSEIEVLYARHPCWQALGRRFAETALVERESRAHELLTLSATERFTRFCETHAELLPKLRSYDVASYLGITPVSLSRLRSKTRFGGVTVPKAPSR